MVLKSLMTFIVKIENDEDKDDDTDAGPTRYMSGVTEPKVGSEIRIRSCLVCQILTQP